MKSLTIHGIDDQLAERLERQAREAGVSFNKLIKALLAQALGLSKTAPDRRKDFEAFCGAWTAKDRAAFLAGIRELDQVDSEDWK